MSPCDHGNIPRKCEICELRSSLKAAEERAELAEIQAEAARNTAEQTATHFSGRWRAAEARAEAAESRVRDLEAACAAMREAMVRARVECREIGYVLDDLCEVCDRTVPGADNYDPKNACADNCNGAMARAAAGMLDAALSTNAGRDYAERMRLAEGLIRRCADALEVQLSSDPHMPSYSRDLDEAEAAMEAAHAWLNGAASKERP